ncbi:MAG: DUF1015 family protein [Saprospiraceae bacterium]
MHIKPFRAIYPIFDRIPSPDTFCSEAKNAFLDYQRNRLLTQTDSEAIFIYQIEDAHRSHIGLVAVNDVRDFFLGKVKKHEKTLSERENKQKDLLLRWGAVLKPVLLTFPPVAQINAWMRDHATASTLLFETRFVADGQTHRAWAVDDPDAIRHLQALFEQHVPSVYIADGHHRTSTLALLHEQLKPEYPELDFDNLFSAYFATDQLDILDYNRVVEGLNRLSPEQFFGRLAKVFSIQHVEHPRKPRRKFEIKMLFREHWYRLHWRPELLNSFRPTKQSLPVLLDVTLLNELVLHDILGIQDLRTDTRVTYVEGNKGLQGIRKAVRNAPDRTGFVLYPVSFDDMMCIADAGKILPPKSTYFEPRMKTGTLIKSLGKE